MLSSNCMMLWLFQLVDVMMLWLIEETFFDQPVKLMKQHTVIFERLQMVLEMDWL